MSRQHARSSKSLIIAVIAIILIVAIAFCVLYFAFPNTWNQIKDSIFGEVNTDNIQGGDSDDDSIISNPNGGTQNGGSSSNLPSLELGEGELRVHFINVGQGDCIYIQFPDENKTDMLIDCGNKSTGYDYNKTKKYLSDLNPDGKINHLMLTHCDEDHVDNMDEIIYDFEIENIYMPNVLAEPTGTSNTALALQNQIANLNAEKVAMFTDEDTITSQTYARFFIAALTEENCTIHLNMDKDESTNSIVITDTTFRLTFYCPTEEYYATTKLNTAHQKNAISPIGILEYNNRRVVFTGDSNEDKGSEQTFVRRISGELDCDVLKVGHHGSETSSSDKFLDAVKCEYAVISCNKNGNTFIHPRQATLDRLAARNMTVYRTDTNGTIVLTIDGESNLNFAMETEVEQAVNLIGADTATAKTQAQFSNDSQIELLFAITAVVSNLF
ncbi:MAG: hypothetical protein K2G31_00580 [Clostridia bacterium]|nr:hypothetical protein [Clostridia bacterium]